MEDASSLFVGLGLMILFAVTSMRYGAESRDEFGARRGTSAPRGIVWDVPPAAPKPQKAAQNVIDRPAAATADCRPEPCPA
jgi:hypothetical protein